MRHEHQVEISSLKAKMYAMEDEKLRTRAEMEEEQLRIRAEIEEVKRRATVEVDAMKAQVDAMKKMVEQWSQLQGASGPSQ